MSEPSQLYARVHFSRGRFEELRRSNFPDPSGDAELLAWLSGASYHGDRYTPESIRERVRSGGTIGDWLAELTAPAPYGIVMPSRSVYDDETQTWTLAVLDFSENYDDYIEAVAVFRRAAASKDLPPDGDGLLVYGFLFEQGAVTVALAVGVGDSQFLDESEAETLVDEANVAMEALVAEGAAGHDEL